MCKPEREDEFWSGHEKLELVSDGRQNRTEGEPAYLGNQALEERSHSFVLHHASHDSETTFWVLKVAVLNSGLDDIKGC